MAPTILFEYTKQKQTKRSSKDISLYTIEKPQKLSRWHHFASVLEDVHVPELMLESEGFGSAVLADSEDSTLPKRNKCISLNSERCSDFDIPVQLISLSKKSRSQRWELQSRLRSELEHIQTFQEKLFTRNMITTGVTTSSSIIGNGGKCDPMERGGSQRKHGKLGEFASSKAKKPQCARNSNLLLMKQCEVLLKRLISHKHGWVFNNPVDVVELNIPDYYTVIKHPMDLGTIKSKLMSGSYSSPWDFAADVRLTFMNAMTYNPPNNAVHIMADTMIKFFETRWKPIEKKLVLADACVEKETLTRSEFLALEKPLVSNIDYKVPVPEGIKAKMTDEEKQSLTSCLESLLADLPDQIIDFLRQQSGNMDQNCEEIEIDIESLGDDSLFQLRKLLDDYLQEREARQQVKADQCTLKVCFCLSIMGASIV